MIPDYYHRRYYHQIWVIVSLALIFFFIRTTRIVCEDLIDDLISRLVGHVYVTEYSESKSSAESVFRKPDRFDQLPVGWIVTRSVSSQTR